VPVNPLSGPTRECRNSSRMRRRRELSDHGGAGCRVDVRFSEDDRAVYATNSTTSAEGGANGQKWLNSDEDGLWSCGGWSSCGPSDGQASVANTKLG